MLERLGGSSTVKKLNAALPKPEKLTFDAPASSIRPALESAAQGDHRPAAQALAATRAQQAWDERTHLLTHLVGAALEHPEWLDAWATAEPGNADQAVVTAHVILRLAEQLRDAGDTAAFRTAIGAAVTDIRAAVDMAPDDPETWAAALKHALGSGAAPDTVLDYLEQADRVAPHHLHCHLVAHSYFRKRGHGSHTEMLEHARHVTEDAPRDATVQLVLLHAAYELYADGEDFTHPQGPFAEAVERVTWMADRRSGTPHLVAPARSLLAFLLWHAGRPREAYDHLVETGTALTSWPWGLDASAARTEVTKARAELVDTLAAITV